MIARLGSSLPISVIGFAMWYFTPALGDPPPNSVLVDKFDVIWSSSPGSAGYGSGLLSALKQPTVYDPNNLARSLLGTSRTVIWQFKNAKAELVPPRTLGDIYSHLLPEALLIDLDGDGVEEELARVWNVSASQNYNEIFVLVAHGQSTEPAKYRELLDIAEISNLVSVTGNPDLDTNANHLFELFEVDERRYVIALDALGTRRDALTDRIALVFEFGPNFTPSLACALRTNFLG